MTELVSSSAIRVGAVRGRYFRENFAQGGIDLVQIVPELVTNADAAIAAAGRERGRIELRFGPPDEAFARAWREQMRMLRVPALSSWRFEIRCADDGVGVDAATVDRRLGVPGELPERRDNRGLFGRGLRDVWLAQGAGRIEGVRAGRAVESWFFPAARDDPFAYIHVRDEPAPGAPSGTRVTVPLAAERLPADGRLRTLVSQLVQLRPVLEDPERELWLNDNHPVVRALYAAIDGVLRPIVAAEERRARSHLVRAGGALRARDQVGLRALNDALKGAFDTPGKAGFEPGGTPTTHAPLERDEPDRPPAGERRESAGEPAAPEPAAPLRFKQSLLRVHPGERRGISLLVDPERIPPGTPVHVAVDPALGVNLWTDTVPAPVRGGWSRVSAQLRCRVSADPGARLSVLAEAGGHVAELVVLVVRHRASGWVREIARKDEDAEIEAHFDPESGTVTVFEGRREFKALERAARRAGLSKARVREYLPSRMLEVEVAANTVYAWAAEEILARRLAEERPADPAEYAAAVRGEAQALRYRAHEKLMRAFLDEEVYDGRVRVEPERRRAGGRQRSLLDD